MSDREVRECPFCGGDVKEPVSGEMWLCDDCARRWEEEDLPQPEP